MRFVTLSTSKIKVSEIFFLRYDHHTKGPSKACKACFRHHVFVFLSLFGFSVGGFQGIGTQLAHAVFAVGSSKLEVSKTYYFDMVLT